MQLTDKELASLISILKSSPHPAAASLHDKARRHRWARNKQLSPEDRRLIAEAEALGKVQKVGVFVSGIEQTEGDKLRAAHKAKTAAGLRFKSADQILADLGI